MKSIPSSSSQAGVSREPQAEIAQGALVSPKPTPQAANKKKGKKGKKVAGARLEYFMEWTNPIPPSKEAQGAHPVPHIIRESIEESEEEMSSLASSFAARMRKQATSAQRETTPGSTVPKGK